MIIATAPGRCIIAGGRTDGFGGSVLSCATRERAICKLSDDADVFTINFSGHRQVLARTEDLALRPGDPLNILRAALTALEITPETSVPLEIQVDTEIPGGAGLAADAAMLAAVTGCLLAHLGLRLNPYEVAELIRKIDCDALNVGCGFEEHYAAVFGGVNFLDFRDRRVGVAQAPTMPFASVEPLERYAPEVPLIVAHWNAPGLPEERRRPLAMRWRADDASTEGRRASLAEMARMAKRALLERDWDALGELMNRCHEVQQAFTQDERMEQWTGAALAGGALGAGAADGGMGAASVVAVTRDFAATAAALMQAGAESVFSPYPSPGLTVCHEVTVPLEDSAQGR